MDNGEEITPLGWKDLKIDIQGSIVNLPVAVLSPKALAYGIVLGLVHIPLMWPGFFWISPFLLIEVPYHKKHVFSGLFIYKLVLPEPANSQNEENKQVLHGLCSPPTGKTALLQAVQILLLSLCNERSHYHRPASSAR